ncbi:MAG: hypothetical protein ACOCPX_04505 [Halapricum sp.]
MRVGTGDLPFASFRASREPDIVRSDTTFAARELFGSYLGGKPTAGGTEYLRAAEQTVFEEVFTDEMVTVPTQDPSYGRGTVSCVTPVGNS